MMMNIFIFNNYHRLINSLKFVFYRLIKYIKSQSFKYKGNYYLDRPNYLRRYYFGNTRYVLVCGTYFG